MKSQQHNKNLTPRGSNVDTSPTRPLRTLHRSIDRLFENFFSPTQFALERPFDFPDDTSLSFSPPAEIEEKDAEYCICMDIPGIAKKDIHVEVRDNNLIVSGERKQEREETAKGRHFSERSYGSFFRSFTLPSNVDADHITAECSDGVLELTVPKTEKSEAKNIPIAERKVKVNEPSPEVKQSAMH